MARATSSFSLTVPITAIKIFDKNPYRLLYSIQNLDASNYIAIGKTGVTAGVAGSTREGQHLTAGQPMSDDTDQDEVWAVANSAGCAVAIVEISEIPPKSEDNPVKRRSLRPEERRELKKDSRVF